MPAPDQERQHDQRLQRIERLGHLLDDSIRLPGIDYRIGYDALIGLIPGFGDAAGLLLSAYIVYEASRFGLPKQTLLRMAINVAVESFFGAVPLLGDVFDATYKANLRNLDLLHEHVGLPTRKKRRVSNRGFFLIVLLILLLALVGIGVLIWLLIAAIAGVF